MNNQEVKRGLYRLQNVNNLPKDYILLWGVTKTKTYEN